MPYTWERLPVELWHEIIRHTLRHILVDVDDHAEPQYDFQQRFRSYDTDTHRRVLEEQEVTRRSLRIVCSTWRTFTDATFGGWVEVNPGINREALYSSQYRSASRIDCLLTPEHDSGRREHVHESGETHAVKGEHRQEARILTLNTALSSVDSFLLQHGHLFPSLQVLDLRPASTFLTPKGGVAAGPVFFSTLSTLFPNLTTLLIDLPGSGTPDILTFPRLRRLSYNIIGQPRLSDWQRCARMDEWDLPVVEHVSFNPVGCQMDWEMVVLAMKAWGAGLRSLGLEAEFPDALGILIGAKDWSVCPHLKDILHDAKVLRRDARSGCIVDDAAPDTPGSHPFYQVSLCQATVSTGT